LAASIAPGDLKSFRWPFLAANDKVAAALCQPEFQGQRRFGSPYDIIGSYAPLIMRRFCKAFPSVHVTPILPGLGYTAGRS
jgi:hypothetical protein